MDYCKGASVAVTGAGGSIGSEICRRLIAAGVRRLTLISLTEAGLYNIERELRRLGPEVEIVPVLGSVEDSSLCSVALRDVDVVIHAAAHKHVPLCEQNPCSAIRNNVNGTRVLLQACARMGVGTFVLISSDKAVRPASVMGATKRLCEILVRQWKPYEHGRPRRIIVRFGNVLDSAGSVLPLWREQIRAGEPITLTDERCERYFMSIPEAVGLIGTCLELEHPHPATYVFDMGQPRRLVDLARQLIAESGRDVEIRMVGLRPGEKLTEELHHGGRLVEVAPRIYRVVDACPDLIDREVARLIEYARTGEPSLALPQLWSLVA